MSAANIVNGSLCATKRAERRRDSRHKYSFRRIGFEQLESREMLSISPAAIQDAGEDATTAGLLAITKEVGPTTPAFPDGLEGKIDPALWRATKFVEQAVGRSQTSPVEREHHVCR